MSVKDRLQEFLDPIVKTAPESVPFVITNVSDPNGPLYTSSTNGPTDHPELLALYSGTKPFTTTCVLQLCERGFLDLQDDVVNWIPEIAEIPLLVGWDESNQPILRKPKNKVKVIHLITHTSGFAYPIFNKDYYKLSHTKDKNGKPILRIQDSVWSQFQAPLLFEPGTDFSYGISIDWAGKLVEAVAGMDLDSYMKLHIFSKLDMRDSTFKRTPAQYNEHTASFYMRKSGSKSLIKMRKMHAAIPEECLGGQGLYSTVDDFCKFLRIFINDGKSPSGEIILSSEFLKKYVLESVIPPGRKMPAMSESPSPTVVAGSFFPANVRTTWTCNFLQNIDASPTGKSAGSLTWAGLPNIFFFVDPVAKIVGVWATQVLPFFDEPCATNYLSWEKGIYDALKDPRAKL